MADEALAERCRALKLLLSDVIEAILRARGDWERSRRRERGLALRP